MKDYKKCLETYQIGIELEPNNNELIQGIQKCVQQVNKGQDEESVRRNIENDPEVQVCNLICCLSQSLAYLD